jgi:type IV secretion system protein VirB1
MMACQNLAVPAEVMQHVVNVESSRNPYAIGVVGGQLVRQPQNLPEAVATVRMLESKGYNYSLGVAQVNRANLGKFGLDTFEKAFEYCPNLSAGSRILAQCYASAGGDWGKAFSCYYSGNFTTGYQDGYVQKIFQSMAQQATAAATAIPLQMAKMPVRVTGVGKGVTGIRTDDPAYRVAMRSVMDAAASALVSPAVATASGTTLAQNSLPTMPLPTQDASTTPGRIPMTASMAAAMDTVGAPAPDTSRSPQPGRIPTDPATAAAMAQIGVSADTTTNPNGVFVPQVRGPNDAAPTQGMPQAEPAAPVGPRVDPADLRNGGSDGTFVF